MKTTKRTFINIGFTTIVMTFFLICLVTFAALSLLTADADYRQSQSFAKQTTAYYKAEITAKNMMAHIDNTLYEIYRNSSTESIFYSNVFSCDFSESAPSPVQHLKLESPNDYPVISYTVPLSAEQSLYVTLKINYPLAGTECFSTITQWQTIID